MGMITAFLGKLTGAKMDTKGNSPGKSVVATAECFDGQTLVTEVFQSPGVMGVPPDDSRAIIVPVGGSIRYTIAMGTHNYQIEIDATKGETVIYSTTADGKTVKAKIKLTASGDVEINGNSKNFVTHAELKTALDTLALALTAHVHPETGTTTSPSPSLIGLTIDISAAKTNTVKTG